MTVDNLPLILPLILSLFMIMGIPGIYAESVPDWVKNTAGWWATDAISEKEFVNAIEFLANDGIISVKPILSLQQEIEILFNRCFLTRLATILSKKYMYSSLSFQTKKCVF